MSSNLVAPALAALVAVGMVVSLHATHGCPSRSAANPAPSPTTVASLAPGGEAGANAELQRIRAAAKDVCGAEPTDRAAFGAQYDWCVSSVANRVAAASLGAPSVILTKTDR